jgi:hypothetical protein
VLYELPSLAAPSVVDVIVRPAEATVIDSCSEAVCCGDPLSVTVTAKLAVPLPVGVPEMPPPLDRLRPAGRLPDASDHV